MALRTLGRNLRARFGCSAVGGLVVKGTAREQGRAVARALELGINFFDTAPMSSNGESERYLGRVLANLRLKDAIVCSRVWIAKSD